MRHSGSRYFQGGSLFLLSHLCYNHRISVRVLKKDHAPLLAPAGKDKRMSAYKKDFVVAVKVAGKVVRETKGKNGERNVFLQHDTQYSLLLKNLTNQRAAASIEIDGTDAMGGEKIVVPANSSTELKRFMLDGNSNKGESFKFVSLESGDEGIIDPTSKDNGLVSVSFFEEQHPFVHTFTTWVTPPIDPWPYRPYINPFQTYESSSGVPPGGCTVGSSAKSAPPDSVSSNTVFNCSHDPSGATAEGERINQSFGKESFELNNYASSIVKLRLRLKRTNTQCHMPSNCPECNTRKAPNWSHCPICGYNYSCPQCKS